jgi:hypothetical protein
MKKLLTTKEQEETNISDSKSIDWEYQMAYQRGIDAVVWAMPAVSMISMRKGNFSLGGGYNTVYWISQTPTPLAEAITPNNQTPYASVYISTKNGPVVLEIPPASKRTAIFGSAIDVWQVPVADIGPAGLDQGKGGKYLFLPPGYDGKIPEGYFAVPMDLYDAYIAMRLIPLDGASYSEAAKHAKNINAYPLNQAANPPKGNYIDMADKRIPTLPVYDLSFFADITELLNEEPLLERDKVMGGMLASIDIEKGKPFAPEGKMKQALEKAAKDGFAYLEYVFETPGYSTEIYWPDRQWLGIKQPSKEGFVYDEGEYLLLDERGSLFHWVTFIPRHLGKASAYLLAIRDAEGELLSGKQNYKLNVPANVPARDFWSVIAYGKTTKSFIYNDTNKVGISSYDKSALKVNEDGSIDIYFTETTPEGLESNWIPTAGADFFLLFRFYGPEEAYFDKSFKLPDVERIK